VRTLHTQRGVVTVTRMDDGRVRIDIEHPGGHVAEQPFEITRVPGLADAAGKQAGSITGNMS
jgi:hypothetical protein